MSPGSLLCSDETDRGMSTGIVLYKEFIRSLLPKIRVIILTAIVDDDTLTEVRNEPCVKEILFRPVSLDCTVGTLQEVTTSSG